MYPTATKYPGPRKATPLRKTDPLVGTGIVRDTSSSDAAPRSSRQPEDPIDCWSFDFASITRRSRLVDWGHRQHRCRRNAEDDFIAFANYSQ
jgi:hypothetical protein